MLRLTRQMTTRACVWKSGSLTVEIATFPLAAAWAYEESRKHSRRDAACRVFVGMIPRLDPLEYTYAEFQAKHKQRAHMKLNTARVWLGGIAGGVVWTAWGFFVGLRQAPFYEAMQKQGLFLKEPRYPLFTPIWIVLIFVMSILIAHLYAWARATAGPGPKTALKIGMIVGFCAGVPGNFGQAAWSPIPRLLPLGWMLDLWIGSILAAVVAGFVYKE